MVRITRQPGSVHYGEHWLIQVILEYITDIENAKQSAGSLQHQSDKSIV